MWERLRNISKKIKFFSQFRVKIECSCSNGSNEPRIFKFPKFRLNCGTSAILWHKFYLKMNFIRVWPWKISCIVSHFVSLTQFCGTHSFNQSHSNPDESSILESRGHVVQLVLPYLEVKVVNRSNQLTLNETILSLFFTSFSGTSFGGTSFVVTCFAVTCWTASLCILARGAR